MASGGSFTRVCSLKSIITNEIGSQARSAECEGAKRLRKLGGFGGMLPRICFLIGVKWCILRCTRAMFKGLEILKNYVQI